MEQQHNMMKNYLWQVLPERDHFVITVNDSAGNQVRFDVTVVYDTTAPTTTISSAIGSDVPVGSGISVPFSEAMNKSSVRISIDGVSGVITWNDNVATFTPSSALAYDTTYTVTVTGEDFAGNAVTSSWSFTTLKEDGVISGTVRDANGNANATVTLSNGMNTTTDANGYFEFDKVASG
jgi:hypothetical protein